MLESVGNDAQVSDVDTSVGDASRETVLRRMLRIRRMSIGRQTGRLLFAICTVTNGFQTGSGTNFGDVAGDFTVQQLDGSSDVL